MTKTRLERIETGIPIVRELLLSKEKRVDSQRLRDWVLELLKLMEDHIHGRPEPEPMSHQLDEEQLKEIYHEQKN